MIRVGTLLRHKKANGRGAPWTVVLLIEGRVKMTRGKHGRETTIASACLEYEDVGHDRLVAYAEAVSWPLDDAADRIAVAILADVTNRRGWRQEWDGFDTETRSDIRMTWKAAIAKEIP